MNDDDLDATPAPVSDHVRRLVGKLHQWQLCMSYNESYFGEPAGLVKSTVEELAHAVNPIYPPEPEPKDPLAGVQIFTTIIPRCGANDEPR